MSIESYKTQTVVLTIKSFDGLSADDLRDYLVYRLNLHNHVILTDVIVKDGAQ